MGMFDNYTGLRYTYYPTNNSTENTNYRYAFVNKPPYPCENIKGNIVSLMWKIGENVSFDVNMQPTVMVEKDAIILTESGEVPNAVPQGTHIGTREYNTADIKTWVLKRTYVNTEGITQYVWEEETPFTLPVKGFVPVILQTLKDVSIDEIDFTIYGYNHEEVYNAKLPYLLTVPMHITNEMAAVLIRGNYIFEYALLQGKSVNRKISTCITII